MVLMAAQMCKVDSTFNLRLGIQIVCKCRNAE